MKANKIALACMSALSLAASVVTGCAGDRPLRNGVPNEQLFLRKSFIIRPGVAGTPEMPAEDDGWMLKATVLKTSTPNPLAESVLFTGAENNGMLVRFVATQDQLQLVNLREISDTKEVQDQGTRTPEVVNAWPASHGDLKLAVTADGEKTNRFEENQELDWHVRQWVKVNLAKNDLSDFALFGQQTAFFLGECTSGASTTVEPDSILVDEPNNYMEWKVSITIPVRVDKPACMEAFGESGQNFLRLGRNNVTAVVKYSMVRATPTSQIKYQPLEIEEKDPIKRKYGPIWQTNFARDPQTGQVAARQFATRFDPNKELVLYFAKGYPEEKKVFFTGPGGIVEQTNALFEKSGAAIRMKVKNYDEDMPETASEVEKKRGREYGDIRYNFIRWMSDLDVGAPFIGVAQFVPDPRTGEALSASINIADFPLKEFVAMRVDGFLETIMCRGSKIDSETGAKVCSNLTADQPWGPPMVEIDEEGKVITVHNKHLAKGKLTLTELPEQCTPGDQVAIAPTKLNETYGKSSLFSKMQEYLGEPVTVHGPLGPRDFVPPQDADFHDAYIRTVPYYIFADPATNPFVTPVGDGGEFGSVEQMRALEREVDFHRLAGQLDRGETPYDPAAGIDGIGNFVQQMKDLQLSHRDFKYKKQFMHKAQRKLDEAGELISFTGVMEKAGRRCTSEGRWETREEWLDKVVQTYHALTVWHEFGHILGMDHNFMASVDRPNFPHYKLENCDPAKDAQGCDRIGMYASSVMEYSATPDRIFWGNETGGPGWAPYDRGAISWLYGNATAPSAEIRAEWNTRKQNKNDQPPYVSGQYSATMPWKDPAGFKDDGTTEIPFLYCNADHTRFTPFCRTGDFGSTPSEIIANEIESYEWQYAWRNFRKYRKTWDIHNYADVPAQEIIELRRFLPAWRQDWTADTLRDDFGRFGIQLPPGVTSKAEFYRQLAVKFDDEMSQTNQMAAAFHLAVIQQSSGERPFATIIDKFNGDVTQQGITLDKQFAMQGWVGLWPSDNYDPNQRGNWLSSYGSSFDPEYNALAYKVVASMIGQETFDSFPYLKNAAVVLFARDTHNPNFTGDNGMKDWIGGRLFTRREDMYDFFREKAVRAQRFPELGCAKGAETQNPTIESCKYDPLLPRGSNDAATHLSDKFQEFKGPDDVNYAWIYIADRRQWLFVEKDRNIALYKQVRDYNTKVTVPQLDDESIYNYLNPIKIYIDAYLKYENTAQ